MNLRVNDRFYPEDNVVGRAKVSKAIMESEDWKGAKENLDTDAADRIIHQVWPDKKTALLKEQFNNPEDVIFITQPSTSGTNALPVRLAEKLSNEFKAEYVIGEDYFNSLHSQQSKHISRFKRPFHKRKFQSFDIEGLKKIVENKSVVIVEDILTTGGSVAEFSCHLADEDIQVKSIAALMGDRRLNLDQKTFNRLDQSLKNKNIEISAKSFSGALTRAEAGGLIMLINSTRSQNGIRKLTEDLRRLSDRGTSKGLGGNQIERGYESPGGKNTGNEKIAERIQSWGSSTKQERDIGGDMDTRIKELDRFKTEINLTEYAASKGYSLDRKESYSNIAVMRSADDKINVSKGEDGHWVYYSWHHGLGGTIVDFAQDTGNPNLGRVRQELRPWIGVSGARPTVPETDYQKVVEPTTKDRGKVQETYRQLDIATRHPYLENERFIDRTTLYDMRFKGKVFKDDRGNACFPHVDKNGLSGIEMKNKEFAGFTKHGEKALWISNCYKGDDRLVITESAIDALSYHQIKGTEKTRYASIGGSPSQSQYDLVKAMFEKGKKGMTFVVATDNDKAGEKYYQRISEIAQSVGKRVVRDIPEKSKDWNDKLKKMDVTKEQQQGMER